MYLCTVKNAFMIAAPMSGSGKTTIARGLMALFAKKGYRVQPFKCGPDYIDTKFHEAVCGRPSINLDTYMATPEHVCELFTHYGNGSDICIVEGMMGLFDGYDRERGSSYEIARVLEIPVVLVVDAKSAAYSMAALLSGFINFRQDIRFAGVIFNKVGSQKHFQMLRQVCDDLGVECLGFLPKNEALETGSRYLGLDFSEYVEEHTLIQLLEEYVEWELLLKTSPKYSVHNKPSCALQLGLLCPSTRLVVNPVSGTGKKLLVASNAEAFSFLYQETLDAWENVTFFNPENDVPNLNNIDLLYLPGGYPEKHLEALVQNASCRKTIRDYAERGGRIVAECGGMMYLCTRIVTDDGEYPMCGLLPYSISARKADRKLSLGYRRFVLDGREYRGHEFHYTQFLGDVPPSITQVYDAKGNPVSTPVLKYKNVLASYTHLYQI